MLGPGTTVGRYVIKSKLAEGGMAEIFLATAMGPEGFSKDVVIKVVKSFLAADSQFVQMFIAEARLASKLNHANVVQIFDFGKHGDSYYLAMEYVRGASLWDLRKRCREHGTPFPPTLAAEIIAQTARGLQYAHSLSENGQRIGVVHRDVTPHNVLLSFDGAVKLTDFGIAKATSGHTSPGMLKGKFAYMSPEQSRGDPADARTDIFALGIGLWELLTGGRLFDGDSDLAVLRAVQESLIPPPSRMNPEVPAELSDIVMKALARPLPERFQSAFEFDKALATWVLRNAKSIEDTSVAEFLQTMFKEEFERPVGVAPTPSGTLTETDQDDFGVGNTVARPGLSNTAMTATPIGPAPTAAPRRGVMDDDDDDGTSKVKTEEFKAAPPKPRTEQMPALKRPSRRFEPLPLSEQSNVAVNEEPKVIVRESMRLERPAPKVTNDSQSSPVRIRDDAPRPVTSEEPVIAPKSNAPLIVALGSLVALLAAGVFFVTQREPEATPVAPVAEVAPPPKPVNDTDAPKTTPPVDSDPPTPVAKPPEEVDAGVENPPPNPPPTKPEPRPAVVRKSGTLVLKAAPFATVSVQGKQYDVQGVRTIPAPAGTYDISFVHPKKTVKQRVTVKPSESTSVPAFDAN
ncbi:MAG: serine/threonine protein kinase [Archangium sp.]